MKSKSKLETQRLILRSFERSDADSMFRNWASDPNVVQFMPYEICTTIEETHKRIDEWFSYLESVQGAWCAFAIELKSNGDVIGTIDFAETNSEARSAEVGYQLGKAWWGNGYATEALQAVIAHCFETVGLNRIWAVHDPQNASSGSVMKKAGMLYEKTLHDYKYHNELVDRVLYGMFAEDYFGTINYRPATVSDLERIWDKNIVNNIGDNRWIDWKVQFINNNKSGKCKTFIVLNGDDPIGDGTLIFLDNHTANINALRIEKRFEGKGYISKLVKFMEQYAQNAGYKTLTIGVEARETRNLAIYLHWGYNTFVKNEIEDDALVLYYSKMIKGDKL